MVNDHVILLSVVILDGPKCHISLRFRLKLGDSFDQLNGIGLLTRALLFLATTADLLQCYMHRVSREQEN